MVDYLLNSLFLKAKDQFESANRWSYIIILICLVFHLMTFSQFISVKNKQFEVITARDRFIHMNNISSEIKSDLDRLNNIVKRPLNRIIDKILVDLKNDFKELDRSVASIKTNVTAKFTSMSADYLLNDSIHEDMSIQSPISQMQTTKKIFEINDDIKNKIREAKNQEDLRELLLPIIENQIIKHRFNELNKYWHTEGLIRIKKETEKIKKKLNNSKLLFSEDSVLWNEIFNSMEQVEQVSNSFNFLPPKNPYWWTTVSGKLTGLAGIRDDAIQEFQNAIKGSNVIDILTGKMKTVLSKQDELQNLLEKRLKKIHDDFENYQSKILSINKAFGIISLDLNYIVPIFPLLLGIILSINTFWFSYRLRELIGTGILIARNDSEMIISELVYLWTGFSFKKSLANDHSEQKLNIFSLRGKNIFQKESYTRLIIYWSWIIIAVVQLIGLNGINSTQVVIFGILGCLLVFLTLMYQWVIVYRFARSSAWIHEKSISPL